MTDNVTLEVTRRDRFREDMGDDSWAAPPPSTDLTEYELQRQRNIARNEAMLRALGLLSDLGHASAFVKPARPYAKKIYVASTTRLDALRDRNSKLVDSGPVPRDPKEERAARAAAREADLITPKEQAAEQTTEMEPEEVPDRGVSTDEQDRSSKGKRGGWNASADYEGVAKVRGSGISARFIAIRKRPAQRRLYGYVGRTQVSWHEDCTSFPMSFNGVQVLEYKRGEQLPELITE